jgi:hypothetical protein
MRGLPLLVLAVTASTPPRPPGSGDNRTPGRRRYLPVVR